jgi:hypothetical protein
MGKINQTAVEYAVDKLQKLIPEGNEFAIGLILEFAKEKERQEIIQFATDWYNFNVRSTAPTGVEQYYNDMYGK